MVNYLMVKNRSIAKGSPNKLIMVGILLMAGALMLSLTLLRAHGMEISAVLGQLGVPYGDRGPMATTIVAAVQYGGIWLASLEFPIIAPVAGYIAYLIAVYGFSLAVAA